jgi:hypothetical protein
VVLKSPMGDIRGEIVKYNFETKKGEILKARMRMGEWYAGGDKIDLVSEDRYKIENGYITSCDREKPHYKITSKNMVIYPDNKVVAKNVAFSVGNVPVMYLPKYNYSLEAEWPAVNFIPGKKSKWGVFALTNYRYEIDEDNKFTLLLDARENWGMGEGLNYKYGTDAFGKGIIKTYYSYQRNVDRNEPVKGEAERYRVQLRHRWNISDNTEAFMEYHKLSDSTMTKDYFYKEEYQIESSPESYIYLLNKHPEYAASFLTGKRVNKFNTETERLPEVRFDLKDQKLYDTPFYFKTDTSFTNLSAKTADNSSENDVVRFDTFNRISSPFRVADFLSISPFIGERNTFYSKDLNGGNENKIRTALYSGIDASAKFFKTYDVYGKFLGVDFDKVRHIVTPSVEYNYIHEPSISPDALRQFDDIDALSGKNTFSMAVENKFQTKKEINGILKTVDLARLLVTCDYLYKPVNGSRFSNAAGDLELTPFDWLRIESDTKYDPDSRDFNVWNLDFYTNRSKKWQLGFGSRYWQDNEHELTSELFYRINDQWAFRFYGRYDLKEVEASGNKIINRFSSKEISVMKDLHCWIGEFSLSSDRDGGNTAWMSLKLKASPKEIFDFKDYYAIPKKEWVTK